MVFKFRIMNKIQKQLEEKIKQLKANRQKHTNVTEAYIELLDTFDNTESGRLKWKLRYVEALNNYFVTNTKAIEGLIKKYMIDESED